MNLKDKLTDPIFKICSTVASLNHEEVYVIGGYVRDLILRRENTITDIDILCVGDGLKFAKKVHAVLKLPSEVKYFKRFGTAMIKNIDGHYEFVGARKESYSTNSRKPLVEKGSLEDDQNRRDFTINTLAISLNKKTYGDLIDPFNGIEDIKNNKIRTPLDPTKTFSDDPLRMMRAIRFATQLNFKINEECFKGIIENRERLNIVSNERIISEFEKILLSKKPSTGIKLLFDSKLLNCFFPELTDLQGVETINGLSHKDNFFHTLKVVDNVRNKTDNIWLIWAALLHDIGKPKTKKFNEEIGWTFHAHDFLGAKMLPSIFKRLKLPLNNKLSYVKKMVELHLRPISLTKNSVTDSAIRRLLYDAGEDIDDLMLLCEADITSKNPEKVKKYLTNFTIVRKKLLEIEEKDRIRNWKPPIDGKQILEIFNIEEWKKIGILKDSLKESILDGEVKKNRKDALKFLTKKWKEINN